MLNKDLETEENTRALLIRAGGLYTVYRRFKKAYLKNLDAAGIDPEQRKKWVTPNYYWWLGFTASPAYLVEKGDLVEIPERDAKAHGGKYAVVSEVVEDDLSKYDKSAVVYDDDADELEVKRAPLDRLCVRVICADGKGCVVAARYLKPADLPPQVLALMHAKVLPEGCPFAKKGGAE